MEFGKPQATPSSLTRLARRASALVLCLVVGVLLVSSAGAQSCTDSTVPGTFIGFSPWPGEIEKPNSCNLLPCYEPEEDGGAYLAVDDNCDALSGSCPIQLRVPLKFPGNSQMPTNGHVRVYWFNQGTPDPEPCLPPPFGSCAPISLCGPLGAEILVDRGETFIQIGASCASIAAGQSGGGSFSVSAYACQTFSGECTERLDVPGLELPSPEEMWDLLGCDPPPPPCDSCPCNAGGGGPGGFGGGGNFGGGPPGFSPGFSGPGAVLSYRGRGAGHPGFPGTTEWNETLGRYWSHDYAERIVEDPDDSHVWLITSDAGFLEFSGLQGGIYQTVSPSDEYRQLSRTAGGWELRDLDGTLQSFDASGLWIRTEDLNGNASVATYAAGKLASVSFPDALSETFSYHADGKLAAITEVGVDGVTTRTWSYTWSGPDLVRIDRPDATAWTFRYDDVRHPGFMTRMTLVGTDGSERVESAWEYDGRGNTVRLWKGATSFSSAAVVEKHTFSFDNPFRPTFTEVTGPLGSVTSYEIERDPGGTKPRIARTTGVCTTCGAPNSRQLYDDPGHPLRPTREIDARGATTLFEYDAFGQLTSQTEAMSTNLERTTTWKYHPSYPALVTEIEQPSTTPSARRRVSWTYDASGNPTLRTEEGFENGSAFRYETVMTYNSAGQLESVDPPGYAAQDKTTFTYDPGRGNLVLSSTVQPLVGTTSFGYDPFNRQTSMTDPNGVVTRIAFDELDRVTSVTVEGATPADHLVTTYTYTPMGDLHRVILPKGNVLEYSYDHAGRQTSIERKPGDLSRGERTLFTLDGFGNKVRTQQQSWDGQAWVTESFTEAVFSSACHLDKTVQADGSVTENAFDCNGNLERTWDVNHPSGNQAATPTQTYAYDVLDRITSITEPWGGAGGGVAVTSFEYDARDHVVKVVDAKGVVTEYEYSDRGVITREVSEDRGVTIFELNEHAQLDRKTDARGVTLLRTLDSMDRVVFVDYPGTELDTTYTYDDPAVPFSKGRLTSIVRNGERIDYRYDRLGRILQDGALVYEYDRNGSRTSITYPGGVRALYTYDHTDRQTALALERGAGAASESVVSSAHYKPKGPLAGFAFGNGLSEVRTYDQRYAPAGIQVPGRLHWTLATDSFGNVLGITDVLDTSRSRTYTYQDYQYLLTSGNGPWGNLSWSYDKTGDRISENRDGSQAQYLYEQGAAGNTSKLAAWNPQSGDGIEYLNDAAGNLISQSDAVSKTRFGYDAEGRLGEVRNDVAEGVEGLVTFGYDGRGFLSKASFASPVVGSVERETSATYGSLGTLYHRTSLLRRGPSELRGAPEVLSDAYVLYFAGRPVVIFEIVSETDIDGVVTRSESLLFLTTDHLDTPVAAYDEAGVLIWQGGFDPYGEDYASAMEAGVFLRFPGQWVDETWSDSTDLYYNVNRWYDPDTGRYSQADPLGMFPPERATSNLFVYALGNPLSNYDPLGLRSKKKKKPKPPIVNDPVTKDPDMITCIYCLFKSAGSGFRNSEEALWITCDPSGKFGCSVWPSTANQGTSTKSSTSFKGTIPANMCGLMHTHPLKKPAEPSTCKGCDVDVSKRLGVPIYTVHPTGIWRFDPTSGKVEQVEDADWDKRFKKICGKKPC